MLHRRSQQHQLWSNHAAEQGCSRRSGHGHVRQRTSTTPTSLPRLLKQPLSASTRCQPLRGVPCTCRTKLRMRSPKLQSACRLRRKPGIISLKGAAFECNGNLRPCHPRDASGPPCATGTRPTHTCCSAGGCHRRGSDPGDPALPFQTGVSKVENGARGNVSCGMSRAATGVQAKGASEEPSCHGVFHEENLRGTLSRVSLGHLLETRPSSNRAVKSCNDMSRCPQWWSESRLEPGPPVNTYWFPPHLLTSKDTHKTRRWRDAGALWLPRLRA